MSLCVTQATVSGVVVLVPDAATTNCADGVLLTWAEYQSVIITPTDFAALGITSEALAADYAFGFSAVGIGFVLAFPIAMALKALKLL